MATHFFCPNCWQEIDERIIICPYCEYDILKHADLSYEERLICALRHPIDDSRMLAIQLLGDMRSRKALPHFATILETEDDFYIIREIIFSLAKIGNTECIDLIRRMKTHTSQLVRRVAEEINGV